VNWLCWAALDASFAGPQDGLRKKKEEKAEADWAMAVSMARAAGPLGRFWSSGQITVDVFFFQKQTLMYLKN
jgi:hypothetical protein